MFRLPVGPRRHLLVSATLIFSMLACRNPVAPATFDAAFALSGGELQVVQGEPTTLWVIADTLRFRSDGSGEKRAILESRFGAPTRQTIDGTFTYEREGSRVAVTWLHPCSPGCDIPLITTFYTLHGGELRGEIGSQAVLYVRVGSTDAP